MYRTFLLAVVALSIVAVGCKTTKATADRSTASNGSVAPPGTTPPATAPPITPVARPVSKQKPLPRNDSLFLSFERTPCFGPCPTYKVTILQDGSALYQGRRFVDREGTYRGQLDAQTMDTIRELVEARGFYGFEDEYDSPVTDLPSVIIRVRMDGRDKQVVGRVGPPQAFKNLTQQLEALIERVDWQKEEPAQQEGY